MPNKNFEENFAQNVHAVLKRGVHYNNVRYKKCPLYRCFSESLIAIRPVP